MGGKLSKHTPFESLNSNGHRSLSWKTEVGSSGDSAFHCESAQLSSSDNSSNLQAATACEGRETSAAPTGMEQEEELATVLRGDAYEAKVHGPPKPPCNAERVAAVRQIDLLDEPPDPKLGKWFLRLPGPQLCLSTPSPKMRQWLAHHPGIFLMCKPSATRTRNAQGDLPEM